VRRASLLASLIVGAIAGTGGSPARADGAFPDEMQIFLPPDQPHRIIVSTTFGLLVSDDDGAHFRFVCEEAVGPVGHITALYQAGPGPLHALYAANGNRGMSRSIDGACSWSLPSGTLAEAYVPDLFPDPSDAMHVVAIGTPFGDGGFVPWGLYDSHDSGATFTGPLFADTQMGILTGVEIARSSPQTLYLTMKRSEPLRPFVVRSTDGGANWQMYDATPTLGAAELRILAVDPADPMRLYLRAIPSATGDQLVLSSDGGATLHSALTLPGAMSSFLVASDGTLLVGTRSDGGWTSSDGGGTFTPWAGAPHLRALGERDGLLYACGDNWLDGFALGVSSDHGASWRALLQFSQICGILQCADLQTTCASSWQIQVNRFEIPPDVCGQTPPDGGAGGGSGGSSSGCGCAVGGRRPDASRYPGLGLGSALFALAAVRRGRARRRQRSRFQ
jgi:hypothetical protein